jgi:flagellar motility protein MotE (MotC chaperone)
MNVQLLANRIQMLKKEESKALKKIENTKQRASLILTTREENERKLKERIHILQLVRNALAAVDHRTISVCQALYTPLECS